jgi:hypothetical protein
MYNLKNKRSHLINMAINVISNNYDYILRPTYTHGGLGITANRLHLGNKKALLIHLHAFFIQNIM